MIPVNLVSVLVFITTGIQSVSDRGSDSLFCVFNDRTEARARLGTRGFDRELLADTRNSRVRSRTSRVTGYVRGHRG